ncbi:MAG: ATP-binding cassette domain-containing protein [Dethiobacter sp.]|nr:ATP-binding cassette domain-containing protein [Dethiobacter sp.]MCL5981129.1 ATP-binding cassette domain-containing protein [Bacillota bacterium]
MADLLVRVENLKKYFPINDGVFSRTARFVKAVDGLSFTISKGETYGLVGESGSGKSTTGRVILQLQKPTAGAVYFRGQDMAKLSKNQLRELRKEIQIIFQDPYSSLNPRMTAGEAIAEGLAAHGLAKGKKRREVVENIMDACGLAPYHHHRYPHEFSGGQRQRVVIARALALQPSFVVADEPVSALDVSIQAQIINLLKGLQEKFSLTYLFISHDLSVIKHISDRVGVMYLGTLAEEAPKSEFYAHPYHPYSKALLSAVPSMDPTTKKQRLLLQSHMPSPAHPPQGCLFHPRCSDKMPVCQEVAPFFREVAPGHRVACHLAE